MEIGTNIRIRQSDKTPTCGSNVIKVWLRLLGGAYIVIGGLDSFLFMFIMVVYGGKAGIEGIKVEEYVPAIGHLGGWMLYVLLGFSGASILAGVGLLMLKPWSGRLALFLSIVNLFIIPFGTIIAFSTIISLFSKSWRAWCCVQWKADRQLQANSHSFR